MRPRHILYIDDDPDLLEVVQSLLERELPGVIVEVCCTAYGAEAFLNTRCYDVIICDVCLPGELGTDIAEKILASDPLQPIYLMSEYTGEKVKGDADRIGLDLHGKFTQQSPEEFVVDIKRLLDQRPCDPATSAAAPADQSIANLGDSADEISRSPKQIRLTSPHVLAARAAYGKVA